jgi:hypothetical protein
MTDDQTSITNELPMAKDRFVIGIWSLIGHPDLVIGHC